jgi:glutaredoxin
MAIGAVELGGSITVDFITACYPPLRWSAMRATIVAMILYVCPAGTHGASGPLLKHPCGVASKALDKAGFTYELKKVEGFKNIPFTSRGKRKEIERISGQSHVPVLLLDDGTAISGSKTIASWAKDNAPATSTS